ncbi:hypothetical protein Thiowin_02527 [Thiorhodovibrio winogradskyi]|uniref:Uncharacterized protein n=1 Tax=Thiorhodovibrio winogradskyi TaxID=77007 RepID=A0ABZ0SB31_9GAMM
MKAREKWRCFATQRRMAGLASALVARRDPAGDGSLPEVADAPMK